MQQRTPFKQHGQTIGGLTGFRKDGVVYQPVDQMTVAVQGINAGDAQPQRNRNQIVPALADKTQKGGLVSRDQPGGAHGRAKVGGFGLESGLVHAGKPLVVNLQAGIFPTALGGTKQGRDQACGVVAGGGMQLGIQQAFGDLADHFLDAVGLDRPLRQQAFDLAYQTGENALVAQVFQQKLVQRQHNSAQRLRAFAVGFVHLARQQVKVQRHDLGQEVAGLFGGDAGVEIVTRGNGQHADLTEGFDDRDVGFAPA